MKYVIDTEKYPDVSQILLLLVFYEKNKRGAQHGIRMKESEIVALLDKLKDKGLCSFAAYDNNSWCITVKGEEYAKEFVSKNDRSTPSKFISLADKLRQLYPEGKKPGLQEYWRDSTNVIAERLKKFFEKYGEHTDEEIIEATKQYVAHFNGNYRYMKLLKYFIWKQVVKGGELVEGRMVGEVEKESELLSYIQNLRETPQPSFSADWDITLK